jgi:outer membrane protein, heavy metal efflux system
MKTMARLVFILILLSAVPLWAGYNDLVRQWETYTPPDDIIPPALSVAVAAPPTAEIEFEQQRQALSVLREKWQRDLSMETAETVFYRPPADLWNRLQAARDDPLPAATALEGRFSLESLETLALLRNSGIRAAERRLQAALENFGQIAQLDEILRQYSAFSEGLMTDVGPMRGRDPVNMKFPFPGVLALKGQVVNQQAQVVRQNLAISRRQAVSAARKTYWELVFIAHAQSLTRKTVDLVVHLEAVATTRYEAGKTSFQDVIKVRIQHQTLGEELITLAEKERNLEAKLREILDLTPDTRLGRPRARDPFRAVPSLSELYDLALENRQELLRLKARVGKMERMLEMAETMILPSYSLNLSLHADRAVVQVGTAAPQPTFPTTLMVSRGAGLPKMPWYGSQDAYLRATRQKLAGLRQDLNQLRAETLNLVRKGWFDLDRARREIRLYGQTVVKLSQSALEVSTRGYESGVVSFADVIGSYTLWLRSHLTLARKRSDFGVAWAELERIVGVSRP